MEIPTKPGRDLDALVAEHVFGYHRETVPPDAKGENGGNEVLVPPGLSLATAPFTLPPIGPIHLAWFAPEYSTRLDWAFDILTSRFAPPRYYVSLQSTHTSKWRVAIHCDAVDGPVRWATAKDIKVAICVAALAAVGACESGVIE